MASKYLREHVLSCMRIKLFRTWGARDHIHVSNFSDLRFRIQSGLTKHTKRYHCIGHRQLECRSVYRRALCCPTGVEWTSTFRGGSVEVLGVISIEHKNLASPAWQGILLIYARVHQSYPRQVCGFLRLFIRGNVLLKQDNPRPHFSNCGNTWHAWNSQKIGYKCGQCEV